MACPHCGCSNAKPKQRRPEPETFTWPWHGWFAWFPVQLTQGDKDTVHNWVWLKKIEREVSWLEYCGTETMCNYYYRSA